MHAVLYYIPIGLADQLVRLNAKERSDDIMTVTTGNLDVIRMLVDEEIAPPAFEASHVLIEGDRNW